MPQYQKAVEKSKATEALSLLRATSHAAKTYYLANGSWPSSFDELDIDIPFTGTTPWRTEENSVTSTRSNNDWSLQFYKTNTVFDLYIGRISGPYKGAGFGIIYLYDTDTILCLERTNTGIVFDKNPGDYCQKLFKGTPLTIANVSTYRPYKMP